MALAGSHCGGEADETDYDEDDGIGVAEVETTAAHLLQQKKHAHSNNHNGPHEAADAATLAGATNAIAHLCVTSRRSLLLLPVDAVPKHQNTHANQNEGPKPGYAVPLKPFKIVEQEQEPNANQNDRTDRPLLAEIIERV